MFAPYCPEHGSRVLLPVDNIVDLSRMKTGILVHFRCTCGHTGTWEAKPVIHG